MRLIDSAEVDKSKYHNPHPQITLRMNHTNEHAHFIKMIYDAPTVDAVEVVRCKECKHSEDCFADTNLPYSFYCRIHWMGVLSHDFCSYGERKDNE